jgi:predicted PurR-regulated permease PerM
MLNKDNFKDLINYVLIIGLFILAGIILYPIAYSIIWGILFAYICYPVHKWISKKIKNKFLSALFVCVGFFLIIITIGGVIIGAVFRQGVNFFLFMQKTNFVDIIKQILPNFLSSSPISENVISSINSYITNFIATYINYFTQMLSSLPSLIIKLAVVIFTFFFALKDGKEAIEYLKTLSPFKKETEDKFFNKLKDVTNSVLIGQIIVGIIQGLMAGIGYYIFGVPNIALLTIATCITAIIPIFGAWLIWVPVDIYLFSSGDTTSAFGLLIYGLFLVSIIDNVLRSLIVSRRTKINTGIVTIGMLGGLFVFGFLGLLIGPLILAYVLLVIELYRKNNFNDELMFKKQA